MSMLCISEHWLTQGEAEFYGTLEHLVLVNGFYRSEHKNGGVAIYADKNLNIEPVDVSDFCAEFDIELTAVKVTDLIMCLCYLHTGIQVVVLTFF